MVILMTLLLETFLNNRQTYTADTSTSLREVERLILSDRHADAFVLYNSIDELPTLTQQQFDEQYPASQEHLSLVQ